MSFKKKELYYLEVSKLFEKYSINDAQVQRGNLFSFLTFADRQIPEIPVE